MFTSSEQFDDDEYVVGLYDNGVWEWNEQLGGLEFVVNPNLFAQDSWTSPPPAMIIGAVEFKDDIDVVEQQRFKKRYQRKTFDGDVITLQDIKDVVLYTAPPTLVNPMVVNLLHLPATERFLRALILYIQYYLQISDEMSKRMLELETKVRTHYSNEIENRYRANLEDLRLLIAKEYSNLLTGSGDFKKYHHMGPLKKMRSLSKKNNIAFESLIRIGIQIVWLALGRKCFNQIELEMHRLFKTPKFNMVEHQLKTNYMVKLTEQERYVLFGQCVQNQKMLKTQSPLMNEITCHREMDCRLLGLGVVKYPNLSRRLQYMQDALIAPEKELPQMNVTVGILGLLRSRFDTMLREIVTSAAATSATSMRMSLIPNRRSVVASPSRISSSPSKLSTTPSKPLNKMSRASVASRKSTISATQVPEKLIPDIILPPSDSDQEQVPSDFPTEVIPQKPCDPVQRQKWLARASRFVARRTMRARKRLKFAKYKHLLFLCFA